MVKCTSIADPQSGKREEGALDNEQHQLPIHHKLNMEKSIARQQGAGQPITQRVQLSFQEKDKSIHPEHQYDTQQYPKLPTTRLD